jgi:hypothetical protein
MKHRIVVARWDEDVSWAAEYPHVIYNKGSDPLDSVRFNVVDLKENPEGHESHTYLHHIISQYDALDDWTTFVQGWPFDHANLWKHEWDAEPVSGFAWVGHWMPTDDGDGKPHHIQAILPVGRAYTAIFNKPALESYTFIAGAQFVASREKIRSRPRAFWEKVQALGFTPGLEKDWGYTMERLWFYILNEEIKSLNHEGTKNTKKIKTILREEQEQGDQNV